MFMRFQAPAFTLALTACFAGLSSAHAGGCHQRAATVARTVYTHTTTQTVAMQSVNHVNVVRTQVPSGATITVFANFLGAAPGFVVIKMNEVTIPCKVVEWHAGQVTVQLPRIGVAGPKAAELNVILPDGRLAERLCLNVVAPKRVVIHQETVRSSVRVSSTPNPTGSTGSLGGLQLSR